MRHDVVKGLLLFGVISIALGPAASAQTTAATPAAVPASPAPAMTWTLDRLRATGTIRLAYRAEDAPFSQVTAGGTPVGFMIGLCNAVVAELPKIAGLPSLTVTYVPVTSVNRFEVIADGGADLLCDSSTMTLGRRKIVDFSIPTFVDGAGLLLRGKPIDDLKQLAGKKIGVLSASTTQQELAISLRQANVKATVVNVPSYLDGLKALDNGSISALFGDRSVLLNLGMRSKYAAELSISQNYLTVEPYAMALQHGDEDFRLAVDTALSHLYRSGKVIDIFADTFGKQTPPGPLLLSLYTFSAYPD